MTICIFNFIQYFHFKNPTHPPNIQYKQNYFNFHLPLFPFGSDLNIRSATNYEPIPTNALQASPFCLPYLWASSNHPLTVLKDLSSFSGSLQNIWNCAFENSYYILKWECCCFLLNVYVIGPVIYFNKILNIWFNFAVFALTE